MNKKYMVLISLLVVGVLLIAGCGGETDSAVENGTTEETIAAEHRDYILIGRPNPSTGPIAGLGEAAEWAVNKWLEDINADGGIYIEELDKKLPVRIKMVDTESDTTKASELASMLVLEDEVDMLLVLHTPDTVNPVTAVAERYEIPCISIEAPTGSWLTGGPYDWSYHAFWTHEQVAEMIISKWDTQADETNRVVGFVNGNDTDGTVWRETFEELLPDRGYTIVDPGQFPLFTSDYGSIINEFIDNDVQIITGAMIPPDFANFWNQAQQLGWKPKMVSVAKPYLLPTDVEALGPDLAHGLLTEVWWSPEYPWASSLTGESSADIAGAYELETGKTWNQTLGFEHAAFELLSDVLNRAQSLDNVALRDAIAETDLQTVVGPIKYNEQHYSETPVVGGQWVVDEDGNIELKIVHNEQHPEIPTTAEMIFPLP